MSKNETSKFTTLLGWFVAAIILLAIIAGLIMVGSPGKARDHKIDAKRLTNMQVTARVISCYADKTGDLPPSIIPIKSSVAASGYDSDKNRCKRLRWEQDPVSKEDFEYKRLGKKSFELCGVFARKGTDQTVAFQPVYNAYDKNVLLNTSVPRPNRGRHCYKAENWN